MSRIGKKPVSVPAGVTANVSGQLVKIKGSKGELSFEVPEEVSVALENGAIAVQPRSQTKRARALWGTSRARINNLVREAMGFNAERGDSLNVANSAFAEGAADTLPELPVWKDPELIDIGKQALRYLIVIAVLAYVAFGVIKPLLKSLAPPPADEEADEGSEGASRQEKTYDEDGAEVTLSESARQNMSYETKLAQARETAKNNPKLVANLIKDWMGVNEEARK